MSVDILIDGYNLLHFAGLARARYGPGELQKSRERLLKRVRNGLSEVERGRTTVVFDARDAEHADRRESRPYGMLVLFSPVGREADDTIEELIDAHSAPQQLLVVSSDNRLKRAARSSRAAWIDSDSFLVDLDRRMAKLALPEEPSQSEDLPARPARLMRTQGEAPTDFAELDVEAIIREVREETGPSGRVSPGPVPAAASPKKESGKKPVSQAGQRVTDTPRSPERSIARKSPPVDSRRSSSSKPRELSSDDQPLPDVESISLEESQNDDLSSELNFWEQRVKDLLGDSE